MHMFLGNDPQPEHRKTKIEIHAAFTLIELLMVVAIISALAALLLAALVGAKRKAQQVNYVGNLKQLGLATHLFVADTHAYPMFVNPGYVQGQNREHQTGWMTAVQGMLASNDPVNTRGRKMPYDSGVWACPAAPRPASIPENDGWAAYGYNSYGLSTGTNNGTTSFGPGGHCVWNG